MDDIQLQIKSILFFILTTCSIVTCSYLIGVDIKISLLVILLANRIYNRRDGFHNSSLVICFIFSTFTFTLFAWLSTQFMISPLLLLCSIILIDYERIEQLGSLIGVLFLGVATPEYSYLISVMFFSIILAWCINGESIVSKLLEKLDKLMSKLIK